MPAGQRRPGGDASRDSKAPFTEWLPMATLGRSGRQSSPRAFAKALAAGTHAPSASRSITRRCSIIHTNPKPRHRRPRLSEAARTAADLGAAIVRTLQSAGVAACGKHFQDTRYKRRLASRSAARRTSHRGAARTRVPAVSCGHRSRRGDDDDGACVSFQRSTRNAPPRSRGPSSPGSCARNSFHGPHHQRRSRNEGAREGAVGA